MVDKSTRSRMMRGIGPRDTVPELVVRRLLFARGFRYILHDDRLPGCPDIVLPRYRVAVQVHGCFWHGHTGCKHFKIPGTRTRFWRSKISGNAERDARNAAKLIAAGWRVLFVWECATRGNPERIADRADRFIRHGRRQYAEI